MSKVTPSRSQHTLFCLSLIAMLSGVTPVVANEPAHLAALIRQLDQIERQAEACARLHRDNTSRYHFDYTRFRDDVQRMRQGIRAYLSPERAQPRDAVPMLADYRVETEAIDEPEQ